MNNSKACQQQTDQEVSLTTSLFLPSFFHIPLMRYILSIITFGPTDSPRVADLWVIRLHYVEGIEKRRWFHTANQRNYQWHNFQIWTESFFELFGKSWRSRNFGADRLAESGKYLFHEQLPSVLGSYTKAC